MGAGLPVISTLRSLIETGDKILKIEGVLSGDEGSAGGLGGGTGQVLRGDKGGAIGREGVRVIRGVQGALGSEWVQVMMGYWV